MADEVPKTIYNDPCMLAELLTKVYIDRLAAGGGAVKVVRTKSADHEREAQWYGISLSELAKERDKAVDECRALTGQPVIRRRYAILAGSRRLPTRTIR